MQMLKSNVKKRLIKLYSDIISYAQDNADEETRNSFILIE